MVHLALPPRDISPLPSLWLCNLGSEAYAGPGSSVGARDSPQLPQAPRSEPDEYDRWESILSQEDLEEIEQRRKHYWPGTEIVAVEDEWSVTPRAEI